MLSVFSISRIRIFFKKVEWDRRLMESEDNLAKYNYIFLKLRVQFNALLIFMWKASNNLHFKGKTICDKKLWKVWRSIVVARE